MVGHEQVVADEPTVELGRTLPDRSKDIESGLVCELRAAFVGDDGEKDDRLGHKRRQVRQMAVLRHAEIMSMAETAGKTKSAAGAPRLQ